MDSVGEFRVIDVDVESREAPALHADARAPAVPAVHVLLGRGVSGPVREPDPAAFPLASWDFAPAGRQVDAIRVQGSVRRKEGKQVLAETCGGVLLECTPGPVLARSGHGSFVGVSHCHGHFPIS